MEKQKTAFRVFKIILTKHKRTERFVKQNHVSYDKRKDVAIKLIEIK
jgi:hypothetical protein